MAYNLTRGLPKQVTELLKDGVSRTAPEIADELCADASNLSDIMKGLKGLDKVHVDKWARDSVGHAVRCWKIGKGEDAPRPTAPTSNERKQIARRRAKAAAERLERENAEPVTPFRHPMDVWLFGEYAGAA